MTEDDIRKAVHSAYSIVRGAEANKAISSLTLDHLLQEHIENIEGGNSRKVNDYKGKDLGLRSSKLEELQKVKKDLTQAIKALKAEDT